MPSLFRRLRRLFLRTPPPIAQADWTATVARAPWLRGLAPADDARLRELAAHFLRDKAITPVDGFELDHAQRLLLAALCCLPLLRVGEDGLAGWSQLIVYPDTFRAHRSHYDEFTGVVTEGEDELAGEAWDRGPMVLSWGDVEADLAEPDAGFFVAVHEMAHKLDALDGVMDGTPPLPAAWAREWARDFQAAYDALCAQLDAGHEPVIDEYAASAPEEFFAVCTEYHFTAPAHLRAVMPEVAAHLARYYGPSPMDGLDATARTSP